MSSRILIVEDEEDLREILLFHLEDQGYRAVAVDSGEKAWHLLQKDPPDLMLLDLMLPGMGGMDICRRVRKHETLSNLPIIMVTAKGEEAEVVEGLERGADDYITKPFSPKILVARVKTILGRLGKDSQTDGWLDRGELKIHPGQHRVELNGNPLTLTASEFKFLHLLAEKPGWVYTRAQIVEKIRGEDYPVTDRAVDVVIVGLRKKLGELGQKIATVRGVGYKFSK